MLFIYTLAIRIYYYAIRFVSPWNKKARKFIHGRKEIWTNLEKFASKNTAPVWFHCSSLGEFEQGRSLLEKIKRSDPGIPIILTFFSPSGYDVRKNYPDANAVFFLPVDTPDNARKFIDLLSPRLAVFVKYDFWFNFLTRLYKSSVPFIFISVRLRDNHFLLRPVSRKFLKIIGHAHHIFTQDKRTAHNLNKLEIKQSTVAGDTRIDRVYQVSQNEFPGHSLLQKSWKTLILGSIWPDDWNLFKSFILQNTSRFRLIVAPHEVGGSFIEELKNHPDLLFTSIRDFQGKSDLEPKNILVDTVGDLPYLYRYGDIAYVGGGFGKGIHSILEPAAYGIPILFGPNYKKFIEAEEFIKMGVASTIENPGELETAIRHFDSPNVKEKVKETLDSYFEGHRGATRKIFSYLSTEKLI